MTETAPEMKLGGLQMC